MLLARKHKHGGGRLCQQILRRLPVIREFKEIHKAILAIPSDVRRIAANELVEFLQFTVPGASRYGDPKRLMPFAHQTYSEHGEDGMIAEVFRRIDAPLRTFVEIGTGDGLQNNTTALLNRGWRVGGSMGIRGRRRLSFVPS